MDTYLLVTNPIGFFVFTFGPGLLFWTLMYILKEIQYKQVESSLSLKLMDFYEKFEIFFSNKLFDKVVLVSFTGIMLNVIALILIKLSELVELLPPISKWYVVIFVIFSLLLLTIGEILFRKNYKHADKIFGFTFIVCPVLLIIIIFSLIYKLKNLLFNTIYGSVFVGVLSLAIVLFLFLFLLVYTIWTNRRLINKNLNYSDYALFMVVLLVSLFILVFIPESTIYNLQTSSPIHFDVITYSCLNSTINSTLFLSNSIDKDIVITDIKPNDSILKKDFELPIILDEKGNLFLYIELKRDKLIYLDPVLYIHLKTTEGTIPIQIPDDLCEK